jgi:hypothetical protein
MSLCTAKAGTYAWTPADIPNSLHPKPWTPPEPHSTIRSGNSAGGSCPVFAGSRLTDSRLDRPMTTGHRVERRTQPPQRQLGTARLLRPHQGEVYRAAS